MTLTRRIYRLAIASSIGLMVLAAPAKADEYRPPRGEHECKEYDGPPRGGEESFKGGPPKKRCAVLQIVKKTIGGDGTFSFTANDQSFTLSNGGTKRYSTHHPRSYHIEEVDLPADWTLKSIDCDKKVRRSEKGIYVFVNKGDRVTCTFTNFKGHDEPSRESTELFIRRRLDNLLTKGPDRARLLRRLEPVEQVEAGPLKLAAGDDAPQEDDGAPDQVRSLRGEATLERQTRSGNPLFDSLAGQLANSFGGGEMHFQASLSGLRADAAAAAAHDAARKAQSTGAGYDANPYTNSTYVPRSSFDIWVEGRISSYDDDVANLNRDGRFRILYVGADYLLAPGVLVGVLGEVDDTVEDISTGETGRIEGTGWTAGPYVGVVLGEGIYFDARAAWGTSDNDIDLNDTAAGSRSGSFDTDRWLAKAQLTANRFYGAWRITPQIGIAYGEEEFDTYVTTLGQTVTGEKAHLGQATGEVEVGYRFITSAGTFIEPTIAVEGIWSFDNDDVAVRGIGYGTDETRAKVEAGLMLTDPSGFGLRWSAAYDGIGGGDYDAWEGSLWVNVPIN